MFSQIKIANNLMRKYQLDSKPHLFQQLVPQLRVEKHLLRRLNLRNQKIRKEVQRVLVKMKLSKRNDPKCNNSLISPSLLNMIFQVHLLNLTTRVFHQISICSVYHWQSDLILDTLNIVWSSNRNQIQLRKCQLIHKS